jgi:peptidoglycan/LPS O-acetylase OafA/YrhL
LGRPSTAASFYEGIDFLRAAAVFLVLWSHGGPLLLEQQRSYLYSTFFRPGFWGVTLFFSISGFLIIGQLFDIAAGSRKESLRVFLVRRCLRTMPTYWLVTLLVLLLGLASPPSSPVLTANLLFLQSCWQLPSVLPVAWSLVIEVWSYMLYASLALASRGIATRFAQGRGWLEHLPSGASLIGLSLIALPLIAGFIRYDLSLHGASVQSLKQGLWPQLDALAYGGLLAWFQRALPESFQRLSSRRILLPVCLLLMALVGATAPQLFQNVQHSLPDGIRAWIAFGF